MALEHNLVKGYAKSCPQCTIYLLPCCLASSEMIYSMCQTIVFNLVCPEKIWESAALLIFNRCLLAFILMFSDHVLLNARNLPWVIALDV